MFYRETGKLEEHVNELLKSSPYFSIATDGSTSGQEFVMEGEWYFNMGDFENAEISMHKAINKAEIHSQTQIIICAMVLGIRIAIIKGDFSNILGLIQEMYEKIKYKRAFFLVHTIEICEGYIYSLINRIDKIPDWLETGDLKKNRIMFPTVAMVNIVYGRVLLIKGEYLKLIGSSDSFIKTASAFPNLLGKIHTYIYLAGANRQIFRDEEALSALKQALDIAMPDKVYMPFVENCDYILPLLEELHRRGRNREEITWILKLYGTYQKAVERIKKVYFSVDKPTLSEREIEVAKLAEEGFSNKEIGEKLFITQNTVKTQMKRVFEKLNISSRSMLKQYFNE